MRSAFVTVAAFVSRRRLAGGSANIGGGDRGSRTQAACTILKPGRAVPVLLLLLTHTPMTDSRASTANSGDDARLLLRFVEDGAVVQKAWVEFGLSWERFEGGNDGQFRPNIAFRYGRDVEAGLVSPVLHRSRQAGADLYGSEVGESVSATGLGDLVIYGKYRVLRSPLELSVGATCSLPLADGDSGLTSGAVQGSGFVGLRKRFSALTLAGHLGFAVSEDPRYGARAEGLRSATAGMGALFPLTSMWVVVTEIDYAGAEFEGEGFSSRGLIGLDWRPMSNMVVRGGVGAGLSDAAPGVFGLASLVFDF